MSRQPQPPTIRLSLELSVEVLERLDALRAPWKLTTRAEVVERILLAVVGTEQDEPPPPIA